MLDIVSFTAAHDLRPTVLLTSADTGRTLLSSIPLAPLHQPYNLAAIEAVFERLPGVPQVACFDTSFHCGHSPVAELVPLPKDICKSGLQRYGFPRPVLRIHSFRFA